MKIAHVINPFTAKKTQDLYLAQPITFKTMETAQSFARGFGIEVELYAAYFPKDEAIVPESFIKTPPLERSMLDVVSSQHPAPRKLPLLKDILDRVFEATDADYLVYTNADIALMPFFYTFVTQQIEKKFDCFSINRRTIPKDYRGIVDIPMMYAEYGQNHPGHDCFIFPRNIYSQYKIFDACIGVGGIGRVLLFNMICNAQKFKVFRNVHLTFHLGNDRTEGLSGYGGGNDYLYHNTYQLQQIVAHYQSINKLSDHPIIQKFLDSDRSTMKIPGYKY